MKKKEKKRNELFITYVMADNASAKSGISESG